MNQPDEMDLTLYLQTEGRRLAAELARQRTATASPLYSHSSTQQQCAPAQPQADGQCPARSLSEALQRMGVTGPRTHRL